MDMCVTLAALLLALVPLTLAVDINRRQIKYNVAPVKCKLKGTHEEVKVQQLGEDDCKSYITSIPREDNRYVQIPFPVKRHNRIKTKWALSKEVNLLVLKKPHSITPCYLVNLTSDAGSVKKNRRQLECTHGKNVKYTIIPVDADITTKFIHHKSTKPTMGCYNWKPDTFILSPHDGDVTVTWLPAFVKSGFKVYLHNKKTNEVDYKVVFTSYQMIDNPVTRHTFQNVTEGLYEARIKPTGCTDCPDQMDGCNADPYATDPVDIKWKIDLDSKVGDIVVHNTTLIHPHENVLPIYILTGVSSIAITAVIIMAAACLRKGHSFKTKSIPYKPSPGYKSNPGPNIHYVRAPDDEVLRPRIVILYGVDHHYHITAVMSFARLLRKVLDVEVVVEREQSRDSICNISEWLTQTLRPPTTIIVVASEALYQLCCHQNNHCISRLSGDMFAMYGPVALSYLHQQSFSIQPFPQEVLLVSFGYGHGDNSSAKLEDSFRLLFGDRHFEATLILSDETRSENIRDILRCLTLDGSVPDAGDVVSEVDEFLADVEKMDEHIREHGPAWWEIIADSFSYTTETSIEGPNPRLGLDINNETFSVSSEVTASSIVTVNVLCKRCRASSCMTLPSRPSEITREARSLSERRHAVSESSCLTLYLPDGDAENTNDVFTSDTTGVSENTTPLQIEDIEYVAETEIPNSGFNQFDSIESLESVVIGGRDC